ncbi:MAG: signal peptidase II [Actinomycetota bacterium]
MGFAGLTMILVLALDQVSKAWALTALDNNRSIALVGEVFQFRLVRNSGSAFGLFSGAGMVIFILNLVIMAVVGAWLVRGEGPALPLGLVLGGGLGNLADRVFRDPGLGLGKVVDFIYLSFWPTFNLADAAIVIGVTILFFANLRVKA